MGTDGSYSKTLKESFTINQGIVTTEVDERFQHGYFKNGTSNFLNCRDRISIFHKFISRRFRPRYCLGSIRYII